MAETGSDENASGSLSDSHITESQMGLAASTHISAYRKLPAPHTPEHQTFWLWVMCLTGVDYFSTMGYQPSIAFEATGRLAPLATILLVIVTLGCALPVYRYVAGQSPHGQGSIAMLERLASGWWSKIIVLVLLGFAATDFVITKTLSAADAAEHMIHNPYWQQLPGMFQSQMVLTLGLLVMLGGMFMRGFREVIGIAVVLVGFYLLLNVIVIGSGIVYLLAHSELLTDWWTHVQAGEWEIKHAPFEGVGWLPVLATCFILFPKLALGLSGFETGVAVMPLIKGHDDDDPHHPMGRIHGARHLLLTAALIMSTMLFCSSFVVCTLIAPEALKKGGEAANRALAYVAHGESQYLINPMFGEVFGGIYDLSTVLILWFAGASAMSGLLNLLPRYLPRYGMAPKWAEAIRPLALLLTGVNLVVTIIFNASVEDQGEAYATGVMVLMSSAAVAVVIDKWQKSKYAGRPQIPWGYIVAMAIFLYTTIAIVIEKPDGIRIAGAFILAVVVGSGISRVMRSTELRFDRFEFADNESRLLWDTLKYLDFPVLVPHRPGRHTIEQKEHSIRKAHRLGDDTPIVFVETLLGDPSEFTQSPIIAVVREGERFIIRLTNCVSIAHTIALVALELAKSGKPPEIHFGWSERSPLTASLDFVLFGEGNVPWMVRELIRRAEPDAKRRPRIVVG